jgi:hypothetical protein
MHERHGYGGGSLIVSLSVSEIDFTIHHIRFSAENLINVRKSVYFTGLM